MPERKFRSATAFFLHGRAIARAADRCLPLAPRTGSHVALLEPTPGVTTAGTDVDLLRGRVGIVTEVRDSEIAVVEFADADGTVCAHASIPTAALLLLYLE